MNRVVIITNGNEILKIPNIQFKDKSKCFDGVVLKPLFKYCDIELVFIPDNKEKITKIIKTYTDGDSIIEEYNNLDMSSKEKVFLSNQDFDKVNHLYNNMLAEKNWRKEAIIESVSIIFSYECYQNYIIEDCYNVPLEEIFNHAIQFAYSYKEYKKEIYVRTKEILNKHYKTTALDYILEGGVK